MKLPAEPQNEKIVLRVHNLEHSIHFYTASLGCLLNGQNREARTAGLVLGSNSIDLIEIHGRIGRQVGPTPKMQTFSSGHLTLNINPEKIASLIARIVSTWQPTVNPVMTYDPGSSGWSIHCFDPDGNRIDLLGP